MSDIELVLNQHLLALRLIERALHSTAKWSFRCNGTTVPAQVTVTEIGVSFWGVLPASGANSITIDVFDGPDLVWVRTVEVPDPSRRVEIEWTFALDPTSALI
jgi:hypothetical protein